MTPEEILTSLQRLSAPGFNRAVGSGDVVPYRTGVDPTQPGSNTQTASDANAATPGPSGQFAPPAPTAQSFDPNSFLANLSAWTPLINQLMAQQRDAAIPSGQGNAQAQPVNQAQNGLGSQDIASSSPATPAPSVSVPAAPALPYGAQLDPYAATGFVGPQGGSSAAGPAGDSGAGPGAPGGEGGSGGVGSGAAGGGAYKKGGLVTKGNPKSKTDDVPAMLSHGEYVVPREDVRALAHHAVDNSTMPKASHHDVDVFFGVPADVDERTNHAGTNPGPPFKAAGGGLVQGSAPAPAPSGLGQQIAQRIGTLDPTRRMAANEALNQHVLGAIAAAKAGQARAALPGLAAHVVQLARQHGVSLGNGGQNPEGPAPMMAPRPQGPPPLNTPREMAGGGTPTVYGRPATGFAQGGLVDADADTNADPYQALLTSIAQRQNNPFGGWTARTLADASAHGVMRNVPVGNPVIDRDSLARVLFDLSKPTPGQ